MRMMERDITGAGPLVVRRRAHEAAEHQVAANDGAAGDRLAAQTRSVWKRGALHFERTEELRRM